MYPTTRKIYNKLNSVDFQWFLVRTSPHQERMLADMMQERRERESNILEVYCPTHTTVKVVRDGKNTDAPLFAGYIFALSTHKALVQFLNQYYPTGCVMLNHKPLHEEAPATPLTIPEPQMRAFMEFNDNYAEHVLVLEHPYSDYAFNPKTNKPNEMVRVLDGPLAGREGYFVRFRGDRRLVFQLKAIDSDKYYTLSLPHVWDFHVVRLHNTDGDRLSLATEKSRAVDVLLGILQGKGYGEDTPRMFFHLIDTLCQKPSLVALRESLAKNGHKPLADALAHLSPEEAQGVLTLVRYAKDNPDYLKTNWGDFAFRPFLTPTAGVDISEGTTEVELRHGDYTEVIRAVDISEQVYDPEAQRSRESHTTYYAHVGILPDDKGEDVTLFANWHAFLDNYFQTSGKANERLREESFRNYAPTFYKVLTDTTFPVKTIRDLRAGKHTLHVLAVRIPSGDSASIEVAKRELVTTGVRICQEINTTTHLAVWRHYLCTVWLHK